jgi:hypothetical protein
MPLPAVIAQQRQNLPWFDLNSDLSAGIAVENVALMSGYSRHWL